MNNVEKNNSDGNSNSKKISFSVNPRVAIHTMVLLVIVFMVSYQQYCIYEMSAQITMQAEMLQQNGKATLAITDLLTTWFGKR